MNNLTSDLFKLGEVIKELSRIYPEIIFGGSLSLKVNNLIDREIGDLDIFTDILPAERALISLSDSQETSLFSSDFLGCELKREALVFKGVKICFFEVPIFMLRDPSIFEMDDGTHIKIQNPLFAITAKMQYAADSVSVTHKEKLKAYKKHIQDLQTIRNKIS